MQQEMVPLVYLVCLVGLADAQAKQKEPEKPNNQID
jgi:hypothetical protein